MGMVEDLTHGQQYSARAWRQRITRLWGAAHQTEDRRLRVYAQQLLFDIQELVYLVDDDGKEAKRHLRKLFDDFFEESSGRRVEDEAA
jgi:hypothetical protein